MQLKQLLTHKTFNAITKTKLLAKSLWTQWEEVGGDCEKGRKVLKLKIAQCRIAKSNEGKKRNSHLNMCNSYTYV